MKLWRSYSAFDPALRCFDCAVALAKDGDPRLRHPEWGADDWGAGLNWEIEWYVPAVLVRGCESPVYWGYTNIPVEPDNLERGDWDAWLELPLHMAED